jgi:hypothetical protein
MTPEQAAWVRVHVLAPRKIPAQYEQCACQITSNACLYGEHSCCGHDYWQEFPRTAPETVIGRGWGPFPAKGVFPMRATGDVYLADRTCRTYCNCPCHEPPREFTPVPAGSQLDLFTA